MVEQPSWRARLLAIPLLGPLLRFLGALRGLAAFRAETRQRLALLEQRTGVLEQSTAALAQRAAVLEQRGEQVEARAHALEQRTAAHEAWSAALGARAASLEKRTDELEPRAAVLEARSATLEVRATSLEKRTDALEPRAAALEAADHTLAAHARALEAQAASVELRITAQQQVSDNQRLDTSALQAYVTALHADTEALGGLARQTAAEQAALAQKLVGCEQAGNAGLPDKVYLELERRLAAPDADQEARHAAYLTYLGGSSRDLPVLDLGCGIGGWLGYLQAQGFAARGVDLNEAMVAKCQAQGYAVSQGDGLAVLRAQAAASLGTVTALQVAERLTAGTLWQWLAATWQALAPGGRLIIETPNPEDPRVATCTFRLDPQRLEPLPPALLEFLVRAAGFDVVALLRHDQAPISSGNNSASGSGQDYAIVATRPEHA